MDPLQHFYSRFNTADNFERHLFRAGYVLQSAELNEIQEASIARLKGVADALFKDGDLIADGQINITQSTGATKCGSGRVYLRGAVRSVGAKDIKIPVDKTVSIGIYLRDINITEVDDPSLRDPASEVRNYQEPGAARLKVELSWGWQAAGAVDGQAGEFYSVYTADFGVLRQKTVPPQLDSVSQAIAAYDRDSTGGDYIVSGLKVTKLPDVGGIQQYSVDYGAARVNGMAVNIPSSRRIPYPAAAELRQVDEEATMATGAATQRVLFGRTPVQSVTRVSITAQKTETIVHGSFSGAIDPLTEDAVVEIVSIVQGGTTYVGGTDYRLVSGQRVDWSLPGGEPSPGSTYQVTYRYNTTVAPTGVDSTGFTVAGAVANTQIRVSYTVKLPRIDRLCLTQDGAFQWIAGVATDYNPVPPTVPGTLLPLAQVSQTWIEATTLLQNDGLRVVPMQEMEHMGERMDVLTNLIAQLQLSSNANSRSAAAKKGMFVDPFLNDDQRDIGISQTAAIVNGELILPIEADFVIPNADLVAPVTCSGNQTTVLQQTARTGLMLINPYMVFDPIPATVTLSPAVDQFTTTKSVYKSPITETMSVGAGLATRVSESTSTVTLSRKTKPAEFLRQITVSFTIDGFAPNEALATLTFDGLAVNPTA